MTETSDLTCTIDKFTFRVPRDRLYSREDCWVAKQAGGTVRIGLTDFRQQASGDVAFVETPPVGMVLAQGDEFATIETMKVDLAIPCPISGTITTVNTTLAERPELLNQDPYGEGWLVEMTISAPKQLQSLLSPTDYFAIMRTKAEAERSKQ
jgi:glycine cleavage system H protein